MSIAIAYTADIATVTLRTSGNYWWLEIAENGRTMFVMRMPNQSLGIAAQKALQDAFDELPGQKSIGDILKDLEA